MKSLKELIEHEMGQVPEYYVVGTKSRIYLDGKDDLKNAIREWAWIKWIEAIAKGRFNILEQDLTNWDDFWDNECLPYDDNKGALAHSEIGIGFWQLAVEFLGKEEIKKRLKKKK